MARVPCSRRRSANYVFGREHESGTKCGRPMGRPYDIYSANWCACPKGEGQDGPRKISGLVSSAPYNC